MSEIFDLVDSVFADLGWELCRSNADVGADFFWWERETCGAQVSFDEFGDHMISWLLFIDGEMVADQDQVTDETAWDVISAIDTFVCNYNPDPSTVAPVVLESSWA